MVKSNPRRFLALLRVGIFLILAVAVLPLSPAWASDSALPKTFTGSDPKGWRQFQWQMTKPRTVQLGAQAFVDGEGIQRFGLPSVELLPGKTFWVDLGFFSHMGLNSVQISLAPNTECAPKVYETLLNDFLEQYGKEMETRDLDYPNATYQSHDWIVGSTKIVLHHGCPKPGKLTSSKPTTHIWYEKRMEYEPWNQ